MKRKVLLIFLILILCGVLSGAAVLFGIPAYIDGFAADYMVTPETAPVCDAVMVLGAQVYSDGTPSPVLRDRLDYALVLYNSGKANKILVSGDHGTKGYDEVNVMKAYLIEKGVPREDIFMDHAGFDTYDSMHRAKSVFCVESLLVSTQDFHIKRAIYIGRRLGIDAYGYPSEDKEIYNMEYLNARERLAKIKAFFDVLLGSEPKYGGEAIPIWGDGITTEG